MPGKPASVAFLWHMHQPWYGDPRNGHLRLPWVRLHALKDYLDMIAIVEDHPEVHVTFNLVPSLLAQLQGYADGRLTDDVVELTRRDAADLNEEERAWWMQTGFQIQPGRNIAPHPRYRDLLELRGRDAGPAAYPERQQRFSVQDLRDLQVWFSLAWCGWALKSTDPLVRELVRRGRDFSEEDKHALLGRLQEVLPTIIPRYRRAAEAGLIEIATSPYYHPILPLLCHFEDVRAGLPAVRLPQGAVDVPEDARAQLVRGRALCRELLGVEPVGLWPSEGSVSGRALGLAYEAGFRWAASDEYILALSLQRQADPSGLPGRRPCEADFVAPSSHRNMALFFRHHRISDKIGFDYASWEAPTAVADLLGELERAAHVPGVEAPLVSVILDGENCWESYPRNGHDFLDRLYASLAEHPRLRATTFSEYLAEQAPPPNLDYLFPGSWINHDFYIWAGHREDQRAWELLFQTRARLVAEEARLTDALRAAAWEHIYIAEGSDWYWWYGDDHASADDPVFDGLFRSHLRRVWELLGIEPPSALDEPLKGTSAPAPLVPPVAPFTPTLDGRDSHFFEWRAAGSLGGPGAAGAMSRAGGDDGVLARVRYGFDRANLYLAVELALPASARRDPDKWVLELDWQAGGRRLSLALPGPGKAGARQLALGPDGEHSARVVVDKLVEAALPRCALPAGPRETLELVVTARHGTQVVDRWPAHGAFDFPMPDDADWLRDWLV